MDFSEPINRKIYMLWLGDERMNETRQNALIGMPDNMVLITKANLDDFLVEGHPLHPAYNMLSTVHKADYLRCYLMHHHGGGYSDMKKTDIDWTSAFDKIDSDLSIYAMGTKTSLGHTYGGFEEWSDNTKSGVIENIDRLFLMGWFVCRRQSPFTTEWYNELNRKLDIFLPRLKNFPAIYTRECFHPRLGIALSQPEWEGIPVTEHTHYPVSWNILLSQILYPLQVKYIDRIDNTTMGSMLGKF